MCAMRSSILHQLAQWLYAQYMHFTLHQLAQLFYVVYMHPCYDSWHTSNVRFTRHVQLYAVYLHGLLHQLAQLFYVVYTRYAEFHVVYIHNHCTRWHSGYMRSTCTLHCTSWHSGYVQYMHVMRSSMWFTCTTCCTSWHSLYMRCTHAVKYTSGLKRPTLAVE